MNRDNNTSKDLGSQQQSPDVSAVASHTSTVGNSIEPLKILMAELDIALQGIQEKDGWVFKTIYEIYKRCVSLSYPAPTTAPTQIEGWISVEDDMKPKHGQDVLTVTVDGWYRVQSFGSIGTGFSSQVAHWMPLPEAPKQ